MEDVINWELCCLCQEDDKRLQTPKEEGVASLERDLLGFKAIGVVPSGVKVSLAQLDEGQGIATTLKAHSAKYHKACRTYCSSSRLKRFMEKEDSSPDQISPKKLRSSSAVSATPEKSICCLICGGQDQQNLSKVKTDVADANMKSWAQTTKNFQLLGKLIAQAADAHAADFYYHGKCYTHLRDLARAEERRASAGPPTNCGFG